MSLSKTFSVPDVGGESPSSIRRVVVFPAPFGPRQAVTGAWPDGEVEIPDHRCTAIVFAKLVAGHDRLLVHQRIFQTDDLGVKAVPPAEFKFENAGYVIACRSITVSRENGFKYALENLCAAYTFGEHSPRLGCLTTEGII